MDHNTIIADPSRIEQNAVHHNEERLKWLQIMEDYHSGQHHRMDSAKTRAVLALDHFVVSICLSRYRTYMQQYGDDLKQAGRMGILIGLESYNPNMTLPTTFFAYYIRHEIQNFIDEMVNHATTHYSQNLKRVDAAIREYEKADLKWNAVKVSERTGIPLKTVNNVLAIRSGTNTALNEEVKMPTSDYAESPEDAYLKLEAAESLHRAISKLSEEEQMLIRLGYFSGTDEPNYKRISSLTGISVSELKSRLASIRCKLKGDPDLVTMYRDHYKNRGALSDDHDGLTPKNDEIDFVFHDPAEDSEDSA